MKKILSIGNSFSEDAHRYFYSFAHEAGEELYCVNYCIGGCPLEKHWNLLMSEAPEYGVELNGNGVDPKTLGGGILSNILKMEEWDVITIQQVSHYAGRPESYEPYLGNLIVAIRAMVPSAKIYFQETWEYEYSSGHPGFVYFNKNCDEMFEAVKKTVREACAEYDMTMIPSGEVIHATKRIPEFDSEHGGQSLYRDGFHMHLVYGRYLLACVWYKTIFGKSPVGNAYVPCDGESDPELLKLIQRAANNYRA